MSRIFVVEDDRSICGELAELLVGEGYEALFPADFEHVADDILAASPDLVLMDIGIPGVNGKVVLKELRKQFDVPVIMVTSRTSELDEVVSMSCGADDYITKPYSPTILLLRIAAVLRRTKKSSKIYRYRNLEINLAHGTIKGGESELALTKNEMLIFRLLLENQDRIVTRDEMMTELWDNEEYVSDNALTVNISRLRGKLSEFGLEDAIETRKKQGYRLL